MTEENRVRRRKQQNGSTNGDINKDHKKGDSHFVLRESTLTVLLEGSPHIRAIYNIFVVILIILFLDTAIYDLVERGKINIGLNVVINGFGDVKRGCKLWLYELCVALLFYPGLRAYAVGVKLFRRNTVAFFIWKIAGIVSLTGLQLALALVPIYQMSKEYLALASAATVTLEMLRFMMKIHATAMASVSRCHGDDMSPLPTILQYGYFLFAPTLIYRDQYPRTKRIRWGFVTYHLMEVAAIIFYNSFLWERFILPYWSNYGMETRVEAGIVVRGMFGCVLPGVISFLCGFYCLLHAWLNAFAELLKFGDRLFYEDWWTTSQFSKYYRSWNLVVHSWLREHIYLPLAPRAGRVWSTFAVFFVSAIAHEVVLALSFGFFYPVLLLQFGVLGLFMLPLTAVTGRRFPNFFNLHMWLCFFFGNGLLWSLYPMEYFARKNCPPSASDSFFVPKSWSCPEIVLKPDWEFQNPFEIIN